MIFTNLLHVHNQERVQIPGHVRTLEHVHILEDVRILKHDPRIHVASRGTNRNPQSRCRNPINQ